MRQVERALIDQQSGNIPWTTTASVEDRNIITVTRFLREVLMDRNSHVVDGKECCCRQWCFEAFRQLKRAHGAVLLDPKSDDEAMDIIFGDTCMKSG